MALSPNYGWTEPDNSGLVKNGAQDMRTLGDAIDTSVWNVGFGQAAKNKILNSDFSIWQRGTSFSNPTSGTYCADRFRTIHDGTGATRTISQQAFTAGTAPVAGYESQFFMRYAVTVAGSANTFQGMVQSIEDVRTFAGQPVTISFWAKADANRNVNIDLVQNFGSGGSGSVFVSLSASSVAATTSWQRFTVTGTVPSIAGKTIGTGSALRFGYYAPPATACTIDIWGVQVEYGSKMTPFQTASGNSPQAELAMCQRYYWRMQTGAGNTRYITSLGSTSSTDLYGSIANPVPMRTNAPTSVDFSALSITEPNTTLRAVTAITISSAFSSPMASGAFVQVASGLIGNVWYGLQNTSTSGYIGFSAEL
jgi:hypothetical protein